MERQPDIVPIQLDNQIDPEQEQPGHQLTYAYRFFRKQDKCA